jgi:transposase, IS30 family
MPPPPLPWVVREFWDRVGQGMLVPDAGIAAGVSVRTGWAWFADAGGVKPNFPVGGPRHRPRLNLEEREEIALGVAAKESVRSIARRLGRAVSTISREIKNNSVNRGYRSPYRFGALRRGPEQRPRYKATTAQGRSQRRARRPKMGQLAGNERLRTRCTPRRPRAAPRRRPRRPTHHLHPQVRGPDPARPGQAIVNKRSSICPCRN